MEGGGRGAEIERIDRRKIRRRRIKKDTYNQVIGEIVYCLRRVEGFKLDSMRLGVEMD